jgi:hypothetical protein
LVLLLLVLLVWEMGLVMLLLALWKMVLVMLMVERNSPAVNRQPE